LKRVERPQPHIGRRPDRSLYPVKHSKQQSDRAGHAIRITYRKPRFRVSSQSLICNPATAIITTPIIVWIAMVSAISDRPQAQFTLCKRSIL
jgi:hypothetical protein